MHRGNAETFIGAKHGLCCSVFFRINELTGMPSPPGRLLILSAAGLRSFPW